MTDAEFEQKTKEYREKIEFLLSKGVFEVRSGSVTINFRPDSSIQNVEIRTVHNFPKV